MERSPGIYDAVLFDMDGVVTDTAVAHAASWKHLFDGFLKSRSGSEDGDFLPFDEHADYREYVDGKPRYDGVQSFLDARGIALPFGQPQDEPGFGTVCALGNYKDHFFNDWLSANRVTVFPGTAEFIARLRQRGIRIAIFSASRHVDAVLDNAEICDRFDACVDGNRAAELGLAGKPDPAALLTAASDLGVEPARCVVVEDAIAGVEAGRRGSFGCVIGIDREDYRESLMCHGADLVVNDLAECRLNDDGSIGIKHIDELPELDPDGDLPAEMLGARGLVILLDYDGTLTPIVSDYRKAFLSSQMRQRLVKAAARHAVGIISGRDLADVRRLVDLDELYFSGSHGFEFAGPRDWHRVHEAALDYLPDLDTAETALRSRLTAIPGHGLERKRFTLAVHYRNVAAQRTDEVRQVVTAVLAESPRLALGEGKKVFELKPALRWDKGSAVEVLLEQFGTRGDDVRVLYVGDDITDESVFRVLRPPDFSIVVGDEQRVTGADWRLSSCDDVGRLLDRIGGDGGE